MKICAIGDPHGSLDKIKQIPLSEIDLILLTGDLGKADLFRKMDLDNLKRRQQGLDQIEYTPSQIRKAFTETYTSTMEVIKYLSKLRLFLQFLEMLKSRISKKELKNILKKLVQLYPIYQMI